MTIRHDDSETMDYDPKKSDDRPEGLYVDSIRWLVGHEPLMAWKGAVLPAC